MRFQLRFRLITCCLAVAFVAYSGLQVCGAPPGTAERDVTQGLTLTQDRQLDQVLESARKSLEAGDFGIAAVLLQQVITAEDSFTADATQTTYVVARDVAYQLATQLPDEPRKRFEIAIDHVARENWSVARNDGSPEAMAEFLRRFAETSPGLDALRTLAANWRDHSRFEQAAMTWQSVARHLRATAAQKTSATVAAIECLIAAGKVAEAERMFGETRWASESRTTTIAGKLVAPQDWIEHRLHRVRDTVTVPVRLSLPAPQPTWARETNLVVELQKNLGQIQRYYREQGVVSTLAIRPIVVGKFVLTRTMQELQAVDINSGGLVWSIPNHEYQQNTGFRNSVASDWHRRTEADSVFASISSDGKLVVVVQEPPNSDYSNAATQPRPGAARPIQTVRWNKLCAYELTSNQLRWQVGGPPTGPADVYGGVSFLGTPLFIDDLMFVVGRREDDLCLLAMDHDTGHLRWSVKLGTLPPHLADSVTRRRVACPVTAANGVLLCPTSSGMLAAVNPSTRAIEWAYRYPVIQHDLPARPTNGNSTAILPDAWWNEWRDVACSVTDSPLKKSRMAVFVSPDSDQLHAINLADGNKAWSVLRSEAMYLAATTSDMAIVIEPMAVRAHDLQTGRVRWRAETGEVSGCGTVIGTQIFQPRRAGGVAVINVADGTQQPALTGKDAVFGTLIPCADGWISQTDKSLLRLPLLDVARQRALSRLLDQPDEFNKLEMARLDLQSGDPQAARQRLEGIDSAEARILRRDAIQAMLRLSSQAGVDRQTLEAELLPLCESDEDQFVAQASLGEAAWTARDSIAAMTHFLNGLELVNTIGVRHIGDWPAEALSTRSVRADRILLGSIRRILDDAQHLAVMKNDSKLLTELEQVLESRLTSARGSSDPFAVQQLIDRLLPLEWARRTLLAHPKPALYARSQSLIELELLSIAGSPDPGTAARALEQLSTILARSGRADSESIQRRILTEYPETPLANGQSLLLTLASKPELAELQSRLLAPPVDAWPLELPNVEREARPRDHQLHQIPVRVQAPAGSLLERLDVAIDRHGREIRFSADGHSGIWKFDLPGSPTWFRSNFAQSDQVEAHAVGRMVIVRVGSEVFGFQPFNDRGEPNTAKHPVMQFNIVASRGEMPSETWWNVEPVPARVGIRHEGTRMVDGFGRTLGGLGPVRAGYMCYRSQARLVAVDTQTGRRLWNRVDLPNNCQVLGDDDYVYLWHTDSRWLQTLSAIDGCLVQERAWEMSADDVIVHNGSQVWSVDRTSGTRVTLTDLRHGTNVWTRSFAKGSIPFSMDHSTIGVLEAPGTLHIVSAKTGQPCQEGLAVEVPEKVERIVCLHDTHRWYVAISAPVPRLPVLQGEVAGAMRMVFVNGWLYGIDRQSASITWKRQLDSEPLSLTQSCVAPVIVQMWRQPQLGSGSSGVLRLLDTRTGQEVVTHRHPSLLPYYQLFPSENRDRYDIRTEQDMFRITFNSSPKETIPERAPQ